MILSVSRRTDIPAFYSDWFVQRLKEGIVYVQNPFNQKSVYNIILNPDVVDFLVFWTKNPRPILKHLGNIEKLGYRDFYFLFTLNYYNTLELNLPSLDERIETFKFLSSKIGKEKVIWRYDPIILSENYSESFHLNTFHKIAKELAGYTNHCKTSFLTHYSKIKKRMPGDLLAEVSSGTKHRIFLQLQKIADSCNIELELCSEDIKGLEKRNTGCINKFLIEKIISSRLDLKRDTNQRNNCQCISSIDIGAYNTCNHQCTYCYANSGNTPKNVEHSIYSPLLAKEFEPSKHKLLDRKAQSNKIEENNELNLFS